MSGTFSVRAIDHSYISAHGSTMITNNDYDNPGFSINYAPHSKIENIEKSDTF